MITRLIRLTGRVVLVSLLLISVPAMTTTFNVQAGHSTTSGHVGEPCQYGCPECLPDPGETAELCIGGANQATTEDLPGNDLGSLAVLGFAILMMLRRFR